MSEALHSREHQPESATMRSRGCDLANGPGPGSEVAWSPRSRLARYALAAAGVVCVGVGAAGVVVPGLPTAVFLLAASYLFTRSCPWLDERLIRTRFFGPFLRYLDAPSGMPLRARVSTIAVMWVSVAISSLLISTRTPERIWLPWLLIVAAVVGTWVVARLGSGSTPDPASPPNPRETRSPGL